MLLSKQKLKVVTVLSWMDRQNMGVKTVVQDQWNCILTGLGGCASFDIVTILKKSRQEITDVRCELKAERADSIPAVFTKIHLHFVITGHAVKEKQVAKAVELSAEKYCSASKMLMDGGVEITHDFEIIEAN